MRKRPRTPTRHRARPGAHGRPVHQDKPALHHQHLHDPDADQKCHAHHGHIELGPLYGAAMPPITVSKAPTTGQR